MRVVVTPVRVAPLNTSPTPKIESSTPRCSLCGVRFDSPMGYVCMSSACPCGMGPVMS